MIKALGLRRKQNLGVLKNPFGIKNIKGISLRFRKKIFTDGWEWSGRIDFKNSNTSGRQDFRHPDFDTILKQMQDFSESL